MCGHEKGILSYYKLFLYINLCLSVKLDSLMFIYIDILSYYKLFLYINLCLSVKLDSLWWSFTSISFLTTWASICDELNNLTKLHNVNDRDEFVKVLGLRWMSKKTTSISGISCYQSCPKIRSLKGKSCVERRWKFTIL